ncbi:hypothetical protein HG537_0G01340 [Torulaspora globosa]|uniref:Pre-mRNA-splicing factor CWC21 n=1 Tax=Torulaspora globosa TaxID=48254 RepID=A0A7H9HWY4_9SACH|nr:hypothetical protein HG537_0G01340 [Torulaspora sp. CBS 2947]
MSYNGIGLKSAKGSSTSGHIQRSLAHNDESKRTQLKNYTARRKTDKPQSSIQKTRLPSRESLIKHLSKRQIEVAVSELRDKLEDRDVEESVIEQRCDELRTKLVKEQDTEQRISKVYKTRSQRLKNVDEGQNEEDIKTQTKS